MATHVSRWPLVVAAIALLIPHGAALAGPRGSLSGKVNINTATEAQLSLLPGIGPVTASRIVEARKERPFERPWQITKVKGVGPKLYKSLESYLSVEGPTDLVRHGGMRPAAGPKRKGVRKKGSGSKQAPPSGPKIIDFKQRGSRGA